jgi:hypothetical protein
MSRLATPTSSGQFGREITDDFNEISIFELDGVKRAKLEMWIAKDIGTTLVKHYPNRQWGVRVDLEGKMVIVTCDSVSLTKGYHIHMLNRSIGQLCDRAKQAAGEILERHGVTRSRKFDADIIETLKRDFRDEVVAEDSDAKVAGSSDG